MNIEDRLETSNEAKEQFLLNRMKECCCDKEASIPLIKPPKMIAKIRLLGGAVVLPVYDNCDFKIPTDEQRENLKNIFGIEIDLLSED